jgi:hypothetical protein
MEVDMRLGILACAVVLAGCGREPDTPLIRAARNGDVEVLRALLAAGADPDLADTTGNHWTPLMHAIHKDHAGATRLLLDAGADANHRGDGGVTPLIMAAAYGNVDIVNLLLAHGADPAARARGGITALSNAAGGGALFDITDGPPFGACHVETVRALLARDPSLRLQGPIGGLLTRWLRRGRQCDEVAALLAGRKAT